MNSQKTLSFIKYPESVVIINVKDTGSSRSLISQINLSGSDFTGFRKTTYGRIENIKNENNWYIYYRKNADGTLEYIVPHRNTRKKIKNIINKSEEKSIFYPVLDSEELEKYFEDELKKKDNIFTEIQDQLQKLGVKTKIYQEFPYFILIPKSKDNILQKVLNIQKK